MSLLLSEIATLVDGPLHGPADLAIHGVDGLESAAAGDLVAVEDEKRLERLGGSSASAALVTPELADRVSIPHVVVPSPRLALNRVIEALDLLPSPERPRPPGPTRCHPTACVDPSAELGESCEVGPFVVVGVGARIGEGTVLRSHCVIEDGAVVGAGCMIHPHAVIGASTTLGDGVVIGANAVLGAAGFGFVAGPSGAERLHHVGRVEIGDHSEIGAGCTIDRAKFGVTRIGMGAKLDAHVHVAHNCTIGDHTLMAAQVGLAGSTHVGARCQFGGQVGVAGHLRIADGCSIAAMAGIAHDLDKPATYFGYWAKERKTSLRELAAVAKLPGALKTLKGVEARLLELEHSAERAPARPPSPES